MRRFSFRSVAVVVLALCLSVVPVGAASASPGLDLGWEGGLFPRVERTLSRLLAHFGFGGEEPGRGVAVLNEGGSLDDNGST